MFFSFIIRRNGTVEGDHCGEKMITEANYLKSVQAWLEKNGMDGDRAIVMTLDLTTMTKGGLVKEFLYYDDKVQPFKLTAIEENIKPEAT
jgi:hypothetical protein